MLLELRNVDVVFDGIIQVLRSVNLDIQAGKITALLGGNGAGKTTTLKAISGLLAVEHGKVTDGQIRFEGEDISNADPVKLFRRGVVQVLEGRKVLAHLSVEQNLLVGGHYRADQALGLCSEHRTPRQNWGKFKAHKWGGFTGRLDLSIASKASRSFLSSRTRTPPWPCAITVISSKAAVSSCTVRAKS